MKISVIIPTYNREDFILNTIESIKNQTVNVDEIIVIDDGSTDNTKEILKNQNIKYIYQKNSGVSKARNSGILEAKNEWISFLDSDDTWHNQKIEHHINLHKQNKNLMASFSDETWIRNNKEIKLKAYQQKENPTFLNSLKLCKIGASTFFCNKKIFDNIGLFDENLIACEDYDLWLRILQNYEIRFIEKKLTTKYAGHDNQLSFNTKLIDTFRIKALEKHIESEHKTQVLQELIYKTSILLKGAKKHSNNEVIEFCESRLEFYNQFKESKFNYLL